MDEKLANGSIKPKGWQARTELWKKNQEHKERDIVEYTKRLYLKIALKKEARALVLKKFKICEKSFYTYMNKWA